MLDSMGNLSGFPVFKEDGTLYEAKEMSYNYKSKEGKIKGLFTKEGEGFIHGENVYKSQEDHLYVKSGKYTTWEKRNDLA